MSDIINFFKVIFVSCKFMQLAVFANTFYIYGFDQFIVPIELKLGEKYRHLGSVCLKEV